MNRLLLASFFVISLPTLGFAQPSSELECVGAGCADSANTCDPACDVGDSCDNGVCVAAACFPSCRQGYTCEAGACMATRSACVPDCRVGYACDAGTCVAEQPTSAPVQQVPVQHNPPVSEINTPAVAQAVEEPADNEWPREFAMRPLTLPRGVLSTAVGFSVSALRSDFSDTEYYTSFGAGVHLGIIDALQVSVFPIQLGLSPDLEAFDPSIALRAAFVRTRVFQMGASYGLRIPIADDGVGMVNTLQLDFLVRSSVFRFGASLYASFVSVDEGLGPEGEGGSSSIAVGSGFVMNFGFQLAPIAALNIALEQNLIDGNPDTYRFSLAPSFIFNIPRGDGTPLMDISATISLPGLIGAGRPETVEARVVSGQLGVSFYNDLY